MNAQELTEYLRQVCELEMSIYRQKQTQKAAKDALVKKTVEEEYIRAPHMRSLEVPMPVEPTPIWEPPFIGMTKIVIGVILILVGLFSFINPQVGNAEETLVSLACLLAGGVFCFFAFRKKAKIREANKNAYATYERNMKSYNEQKRLAASAYEKELEEYNRQKSLAAEKAAAERKKADKSFAKAKAVVDQLAMPLLETERLLAGIYAKNIVFEKYRNLVAMCSMYEYLASGRCTELAGPNGAYNLYESELRQNLIINHLELVNANLEQIQQNQFVLYQGLMETNRTLSGISSDVKAILNTTRNIAATNRITAYCSTITAANSEAIKYLSMIN